jgi:hypothetical protein
MTHFTDENIRTYQNCLSHTAFDSRWCRSSNKVKTGSDQINNIRPNQDILIPLPTVVDSIAKRNLRGKMSLEKRHNLYILVDVFSKFHFYSKFRNHS